MPKRFLKIDDDYVSVFVIDGIQPGPNGATVLLRDGKRFDVNSTADDIVRELDGEDAPAVTRVHGGGHIW